MSAFWHYLTLPYLLDGIGVTAQITAGALLGGLALGALLASLQALPWRPVRMLVLGYQGVARGTPLILQLVFVYDALPRVGLRLSAVDSAIVALAVNEASFIAEIIRSSVHGVDRRQRLAGASVGMTPWVTLRRIVGPQAFRLAVPALGNETISLLKNTSLASVISAGELTLRSEQLVAQDFAFFSIFFASGAMYLVLTAAVAGAQHALERWMDPDRRADRLARAAAGSQEVEPAAGLEDHLPRGEALAAGMPVLEVRGLTKTYRDRPVLCGVDLVVHPGEVVVVMGASGSGKSTLLRLIDRLEEPDSGQVRVAGIELAVRPDGRRAGPAALARSRVQAGIGMVFQHFDLFAHLSAQDNVACAPVLVHREDPAAARRQASHLLAAVGLAGHAHQLPHQLSGGQQQRVAIARALALRPRLMLFDEPTSALDPELVGEVLAVIRRLAAESMTMVIVTHEVRFARQVADRVVFLADGRVVEDGPAAQVLTQPRHPRTRQFLQLLEEAPVGLAPTAPPREAAAALEVAGGGPAPGTPGP